MKPKSQAPFHIPTYDKEEELPKKARCQESIKNRTERDDKLVGENAGAAKFSGVNTSAASKILNSVRYAIKRKLYPLQLM